MARGTVLKLIPASRLIGRDRQLAVLRDLLERAGRGDGGVALVRGDAGTGKTRLVGELMDTARQSSVAVLAGGCVAVGAEPLRHGALIELVRAAGSGQAGQPEVRIAGLSAEAVLEHLLSLLDRLLYRSAALIVVEDLHWADRGTCEILAVLARHAVHRRLALAITCRGDEMPRGHPVRNVLAELGRAPGARVIDLAPLSAVEVARLVEQLAGPVPAASAASVYERSAGNPLLVEELCTTALAPVTPTRGNPPAGGALRDILLARWAALNAEGRAAVSAAAVAGGPVTVADLSAVLGWDEPVTALAVRVAVDHHVLTVTGDRLAFRHVLTAEAVYQELLPSERVHLHERWARRLTGAGAGGRDEAGVAELVCGVDPHELAPRLAHHWQAADRPTPAFVAALRAAQGATTALALESAHRHAATALALWDRVPDARQWFARLAGTGPGRGTRVDLCRRVAETANFAGDPVAAVATLDEALRDPEARDPVVASALLERRGWYLLRQGALDAARDAYQAALDTLPAGAPAATRAGVLAGAVRSFERTGRWADALGLAREALSAGLEASAGAGSPSAPAPQEIDARYMLGRVLLVTGADDEAIVELARAAEGAESLGDALNVAIARAEQADVLARRGRLTDAVAIAEQTEQRLRDRERIDPDALLLSALAAAHLRRLGRLAEARTRGTRLLEEARTPLTRALAHLVVGTVDLEELQLDGAREHLELARLLAGPLLDGRINGAVAMGRGELALAEGDIEAARAAVDEGLAAVRHSGDDEVLAHLCLMGLRVERAAAARATGRKTPGVIRRRDQRRVLLGDHLARVLAVPPPGADRPDLAAVAAAWRAECDEDTDPGTWEQVAARWDAVGWPRWATHAMIRRVEATARAVRAARAPGGAATGTCAADGDPSVADALAAAEARVSAMGSALARAELAALARRAGHALGAGGEGPARTSPGDEGLGRLTRRELEVLDLVAAGSTNRQIAERLFISEKTASVHVSRILTKLGAADRHEASALARRTRRL